jgi:hypothetical protein
MSSVAKVTPKGAPRSFESDPGGAQVNWKESNYAGLSFEENQ